MSMRQILLAGAVLGFAAAAAPATAMPAGFVTSSVANQEAGAIPVQYRRYRSAPRAYYRPRRVYRNYVYDDAPVVIRRGYGYGGGYGGGYGDGYGRGYGGGYGGGPSVGFSFGGF